MEEPQQYGIWSVSGLGLVIAFRGTTSSEDVFIDANIRPVPLSSAGQCMEALDCFSQMALPCGIPDPGHASMGWSCQESSPDPGQQQAVWSVVECFA